MYAQYNVAGLITAIVVCGGAGYALKVNAENIGTPVFLAVCGVVIACSLIGAHWSDRRQAAKQKEAEQSPKPYAD
jgi:hypothetical protein